MTDRRPTTTDSEPQRQAWVHEAVIQLANRAEPGAVGAAVTVALCGHWEHEGPCRWLHNNELVDGVFRTLFICEAHEEREVRTLIRTALHDAPDWQVVSERERPVAAGEQELAHDLLRVPRKAL